MASRDFCQLWITCKDKAEADEVSAVLLKKRLIACARQILITSSFRWQGKIESSKEVLLQMESGLGLFEEIEKEITKLHSYGTFVLEAIPISKVSKQAIEWMKDSLKQ